MKRWWVWVGLLALLIGLVGGGGTALAQGEPEPELALGRTCRAAARDAVLELLGMTAEELRTALREGGWADLLADRGLTPEEVRDAAWAACVAALQARIQAAADAGLLPPAVAERFQQRLEEGFWGPLRARWKGRGKGWLMGKHRGWTEGEMEEGEAEMGPAWARPQPPGWGVRRGWGKGKGRRTGP